MQSGLFYFFFFLFSWALIKKSWKIGKRHELQANHTEFESEKRNNGCYGGSGRFECGLLPQFISITEQLEAEHAEKRAEKLDESLFSHRIIEACYADVRPSGAIVSQFVFQSKYQQHSNHRDGDRNGTCPFQNALCFPKKTKWKSVTLDNRIVLNESIGSNIHWLKKWPNAGRMNAMTGGRWDGVPIPLSSLALPAHNWSNRR